MNKFYVVIMLAISILFSGCTDEQKSGPDQCLRAQLFKDCMESLPAGPQETKYNDWAEVVEECNDTAYYQSIRPFSVIKKECRGNN